MSDATSAFKNVVRQRTVAPALPVDAYLLSRKRGCGR